MKKLIVLFLLCSPIALAQPPPISTVPLTFNPNTLTVYPAGFILPAANFPALTGDVTNTAGSLVTTIQNAAADGATKGKASFTAADFNASSGNISIDYTNGQTASSSLKGFLSAADWTTFNGKGTGTVTNFSAGDLSPLFTTTEATTTTTPALSFALSTAAANTFFGNGTGSTAAPTFMAAATARVAMSVDKQTLVADTNYTILTTDKVVSWSSISAARTATLPAASAVNPGQEFIIGDQSGSASGTNSITIARVGGDTINGASTEIIRQAYGKRRLVSDGISKWGFNQTFTTVQVATGTVGNLGLGSDWVGFTADPLSRAKRFAFRSSPTQGTGFNCPYDSTDSGTNGATLDFRLGDASVDPFMRVIPQGGLYYGAVSGIGNPGLNNFSIFSGKLGVGIITAAAKIHGIATTEQLRLGFDPSNYFSTTVSSTGGVTFDAVGTGASFTFKDALGIDNIPSGQPTPAPAAGKGILYIYAGDLKYVSPSDGVGGSHLSTLANQ